MAKRSFSGAPTAPRHPRAPHVEAALFLSRAARRYAEDRELTSVVVEAFVAFLDAADPLLSGPTRTGLLLRFPWLADVGREARKE